MILVRLEQVQIIPSKSLIYLTKIVEYLLPIGITLPTKLAIKLGTASAMAVPRLLTIWIPI